MNTTSILLAAALSDVDYHSATVLALDVDRICGFAIGGRGHMASGRLRLQSKRNETWSAADRLCHYLDEFQRTCRTSCIVFTTRRQRISNKGPLAALKTWASEHGVPCYAADAGAVRKVFTGNGNASGDKMMQECERRGISPHDEKEAGAIAVLVALTTDEIPESMKLI